MCPLIDERERILQAHQMSGPPYALPWGSFAEFFQSRVIDERVADRAYLTYYDDERSVHRRYTYRQFGDMVARMATFMEEGLGLQRGDRVATILFNHDETVLVYFAAWTLGVAVVPINVEEAPEKKRYILEHSEAKVAFCWHELVDCVDEFAAGVPGLQQVVLVGNGASRTGGRAHVSLDTLIATRPTSLGDRVGRFNHQLEDEALIVYTSGTTGAPKGVILTAENLLMDADGISRWHRFGPNDHLMCVLPIHHVNGTVVTLMTPFYCRAGTVLNRRFKTGSFWRRIHDEQVTCVSVVPTLLEFLLEADEDLTPYRLARFRGVICGAGPLLKETAARFEDRFGTPIRHGYGLSETTCYSCFLPGDLSLREHRRWLTDFDFPSIGIPIRHNDMAILNEKGEEVGEVERGEICIRGRTVCSGYFKRPDANESAFQWGWFRSGDEGFCMRDQEGRPFFFISGRLKELIIRGGINISPLEIDDVLKGHPGVKFAMAVPFDNRFYGEEIAVYVVPREDGARPSESELIEFTRRRLPFAKRPKVVVFGEEVPYTTTGKPKRLELKSRLAEALARHRDTQFRDDGSRSRT